MSTHVHTRASSGGVWFQVAGIISVAQSHYRESRRSRRASEREGESKDAAPYGCRVPLSAEPYIGYPHEYLYRPTTLSLHGGAHIYRCVHARISHCRSARTPDPRIPARVCLIREEAIYPRPIARGLSALLPFVSSRALRNCEKSHRGRGEVQQRRNNFNFLVAAALSIQRAV